MKKVAIIGGRGWNSSYGGVENAVRQISNGIASKQKVRVLVYGYGLDSSVKYLSDYLNIIDFSTRKIFGNSHQFQTLCAVLHSIFLSRVDHVFLFASGPSIFSPFYRLFGIEVTACLRSIDSERNKWGKVSRFILRTGEYCAVRYSNWLSVNSLVMYERYKGRAKRILYTPNGVEFSPGFDDSVFGNFDKNIPYVLFAARLDPVKRLHVLIDAFRESGLSDRMNLVIAGGNCKDHDYECMLKGGNQDSIIWLGHVKSEQVNSLMRECHIFVLPSILEGMSNSLLMAMKQAKPCIVAGIPENTALVNIDDCVFTPDDTGELRDKLLTFEDRRLCYAVGNRLKERVESEFSWSVTVDKLLSTVSV